MTVLASRGARPDATPLDDVPIDLQLRPTGIDRTFQGLLAGCSVVVLVIIIAILAFLTVKGWPALRIAKWHLLTDGSWSPDEHKFGVMPLLAGSVAIAVVAITVATPVSLATALMINEYAPTGFRRWLTAVIDLLATVPSIVYGFWGLEVVSSLQAPPAKWIVANFAFVPYFRTPTPDSFVKSVFACGLISAITIIPIITSISREVMAQVPRDICEASVGLGSTRWGMITDVVLPFSKNGIVGSILLGFGRGLGETMIVVLVLSNGNRLTAAIMGPNGLGSIAKQITEDFPTASSLGKSALVLSALVLFLATLAVNALARLVIQRSAGRRI